MLHIALHFIVPAVLAALFFKKEWQKAYVTLVATMLVDLDHLLATPVYDPMRCSIGFHPLHSLWLVVVYVLMIIPKPIRYVGIGLVLHMMLDAIDCQINLGVWFTR